MSLWTAELLLQEHVFNQERCCCALTNAGASGQRLYRPVGCTRVGVAVSTELAFLIVSIKFCAINYKNGI